MPGENNFFSNFFRGSNQGGEGDGGSGEGGQSNGAPVQQGAIPNGQQQQQQPNGQQTSGQQAAGEGEGGQGKESDPFDIYNKMFENTESGDEAAPPELALGKETLDKVVGQLDFTSGIDQQMLDQLQAGDLSSLPQLLNNVAKQVYSTSMQHNSALVNQFVGQRSEYDAGRIAPAVRSSLTESKLDTELGDAAKIPAIRAQMTDHAQKLAKTYPDASPEWVASEAKKYVIESASALLGLNSKDLTSLKQSQTQKTEQARDVDWDNYFQRG